MNVHSLKSTEVVPLCFIIFKSYIPRGIVFVLRQQLSVRQDVQVMQIILPIFYMEF